MSTQALNIVLAGTPNTTVMVGAALLEAGHSIVTVLSPFPKPIGRKKIVTASELEQWAVSRGIPVVHVDKEKFASEAFLESLPFADLLVVADFGYLVPGWLLNYPTYGGLNIHPSLLPRWRGATPVPFTLLFGDKKTGVTVIKMNEQFDKGAVVAQREVELQANDTTPTLLSRAFSVGAELLAEILPGYIDGNIKPVEQTDASPTPLTQKFTKDDGFVSLEAIRACMAGEIPSTQALLLQKYAIPTTADSIHNMVCALTPWPGVWTLSADQKRVKILETRIENKKLVVVTSQVEGQTARDGFI